MYGTSTTSFTLFLPYFTPYVNAVKCRPECIEHYNTAAKLQRLTAHYIQYEIIPQKY